MRTKKLSNTEWAKGMMDELEIGDTIGTWDDKFDQYYDILTNNQLKGYRDEYIESIALKLTILNNGNDVSAIEFTIDKDDFEEPKWINIKINYHYGS